MFNNGIESLLLLAARCRLSVEEIENFQHIIESDIDWLAAESVCARHNMVEILYCLIRRYTKDAQAASRFMRMAEGRQERNRITDIEWREIAAILSEERMQYILLKGPVLSHLVYDSPDMRGYSDIDILVYRNDMSRVVEILQGIGYAPGEPDHVNKTIRSISRSEKIWSSIYFHHLHCGKVKNQRILSLDLHTRLCLPNTRTGKPLFPVDHPGIYWRNVQPMILDGIPVSVFNWEMQLYHLCLHLYFHEYSVTQVQHGRRGTLRMYVDIRELLLKKLVDMRIFANLVMETQGEIYVGYVFNHLGLIYPELQCELHSVMQLMGTLEKSLIGEFGLPHELSGEKRGSWGIPFLESLFDKERTRQEYLRQQDLFSIPQWES